MATRRNQSLWPLLDTDLGRPARGAPLDATLAPVRFSTWDPLGASLAPPLATTHRATPPRPAVVSEPEDRTTGTPAVVFHGPTTGSAWCRQCCAAKINASPARHRARRAGGTKHIAPLRCQAAWHAYREGVGGVGINASRYLETHQPATTKNRRENKHANAKTQSHKHEDPHPRR